MNEILEKVRRELREASDEKARQTGLGYFREDINLYGVRSGTVKEIAKQNYSLVNDRNKKNILALCDSLWESGMMEETFVACLWTEKLVQDFTPEDFSTLEKWVNRYVNNWASCDTCVTIQLAILFRNIRIIWRSLRAGQDQRTGG